jgi:hypothetical protein
VLDGRLFGFDKQVAECLRTARGVTCSVYFRYIYPPQPPPYPVALLISSLRTAMSQLPDSIDPRQDMHLFRIFLPMTS